MPEKSPQTMSQSYLLAVEDTQFLLREELRSIRFALEYAKADLALRDWGVRSTVVVFGSARVASPEQAEAGLAAAQGKGSGAVNRAKRAARLAHWYGEARHFGRIVSPRRGDGESEHRASGFSPRRL